MVRSMIAGVAGLKSHQSKLDVIGNNIANVNTWGFKSFSYNFQDAVYSNSINSTGGSQMAGAAGGHNASQVGYGSSMSSISTEFNTGAGSPSSNNMDCMIDGTGFFLVGNMVNGSFDDVASSGLFLSRVGIFRVDNNGYLVDNQGSYVYGYAPIEGTGTPEVPASASSVTIKDAPAQLIEPAANAPAGTKWKIKIAGIEVDTNVTSVNDFEDAVNDWITEVSKQKATVDANGQVTLDPAYPGDLDFTKVNISLDRIGRYLNSATLTIKAKEAGDTFDTSIGTATTGIYGAIFGQGAVGTQPGIDKVEPEETNRNQGNDLVPGVAAEYADELSTIRIPVDTQTGQRYDIQSWVMNEDGSIMGTDINGRSIPIGQLALVSVENPNGLEKQQGYYYSPGANAGEVTAIKPNGGPVGKIKGGFLEMANVDLANEFSNMITTQRGFQANSKIITVTDEMLQELVNMKR